MSKISDLRGDVTKGLKRRPVTVQHLEGFAIMGTDPNFEPSDIEVGIEDGPAHLEAKHFADKNPVFDQDIGASGGDVGGETSQSRVDIGRGGIGQRRDGTSLATINPRHLNRRSEEGRAARQERRGVGVIDQQPNR